MPQLKPDGTEDGDCKGGTSETLPSAYTRVAFTCFFSTKQGKPDKAMLTDFGFARKISGDERSTTFCGSFAYVPPEVLSNEPYRPMLADCWSMGGLRG